MLSSLSRGYGAWTAGQVDPYFGEKYVSDHTLPEIDLGSHRHGITVDARSGRTTAMSWAGSRPLSRQHTEGSIALPKTYTTRKGALQLFVGPEYEDEDLKPEGKLPLRPMYSQLRRQFTKEELVDLSLRLGTLERLSKSVLQFGDEDYDHEKTSVSDEKNKAFLKFLHTLDRCDTDLDEHVQPGGDLSGYLRDLKSSASQRYYSDGSTYLPKSRESQELQAILRGLDSNWPLSFKQDSFSDVQSSGQFTRPVSRGPSPGPPSTPRSTYQVLSSRKVAASIKSGSYLGRPSSTVSDLDSLADFEFLPATDTIVTYKPLASPDGLNPDDLITGRSRRGLGYRSLTGSSIGEESEDDLSEYFEFGKRKLASKKPELSKQGRHAPKGEGHHIEVKVKGKGDGLDGESQVMDSIVEESSENLEPEIEELAEIVDDDTESLDWEAKVAQVEEETGKLLSGRISIEPNLIKNNESDVKSIVSVQKDLVRAGSAQSNQSSSSSRSSKNSARETRVLSIISVQEYDVSRPSSSGSTRTFTSTSKYSPKRSISLDRHPSIQSDSKRASLTGSELKTKEDAIDVVKEIDEIKDDVIKEDQELSVEINETETDLVTQSQIHIDISNNNDEFDVIPEQFVEVKPSDITAVNTNIEEADDEQLIVDDQNSHFTESENEDDWIVKDKAENEETSEIVQAEMTAEDETVIVDDEIVTVEDDEKSKSTDDLSKQLDLETEEIADTLTELTVDVTINKSADAVDNKDISQTESIRDAVEGVKQENVVGKVEEDSVLDDSASRGKSSTEEQLRYEAILADVLSDKGGKSTETGTQSRPQSGKLSRPSSGKVSRPSSGKISRPQSGKSRPSSDKMSRPQSGKHSRPSSAKATPELNTTETETDVLTDIQKNAEKVETLLGEKTDDQSKEVEPKAEKVELPEPSPPKVGIESTKGDTEAAKIDTDTSKTDTEADRQLAKQETNIEVPSVKPPGRQRAIKTKKPNDQRQRPGGKMVRSHVDGVAERDRETKKPTSVQETESKQDVILPDTIEAEPSQTVDGLLKKAGDTEESLDTSTLAAEPNQDATSIISELDALGLRVPVKKKKAGKEKEKVTIPGHLEEVLQRQPTRSYEALEADLEKRGFLKDGKVTELVDESLSGPTLAAIGEGLTEEELELAKQILQKRMQEARDKLDKPEKDKKPLKQKRVTVKSGKKGKGKRSETPVDTRTDEEREQDEIKERQRQEKLRRDQEAKELQRKIAERRLLLKAQTDAQSARSKEIEAEMARFQQEADEIQQAEDQARDAMAELRKKQREERDARRKADLERKKAEVIARREREKRQMEENKKKELEMLEKIQDAEMRRRLREEEERKMYEEERLAQEKLEAELREAQRQAEEEEERMKELERQAEEEAMQRLIEEREAAERQRRRLQEEKEAMEEAERVKLEYLQQEEQRLYEEKQRMEAEEHARREQERMRLLELRRLEEQARAKMQQELEKRRQDALARRDFNIDNRQHKDKLGHGQSITRAWTFSYFIRWPRDSYERSMGGINPKLKRFGPMRAKKQPKPASAGTERLPEDPSAST